MGTDYSCAGLSKCSPALYLLNRLRANQHVLCAVKPLHPLQRVCLVLRKARCALGKTQKQAAFDGANKRHLRL